MQKHFHARHQTFRSPILVACGSTHTSSTVQEPTYWVNLENYETSGLQKVLVKVDGAETPFLFDTGGGLSVITPEIAIASQCRPFGRLTGFRMNGERIDFKRCCGLDLRLNGNKLNSDVAIFDLNRILPPTWEKLGGVLSLASFENKTIEMNFGNKSLQVKSSDLSDGTTIKLTRQASGFSTVVMIPSPTPNGMMWLELDSGSTAPLMLAPHAAQMLGLDLNAKDVEHIAKSEGRNESWNIPEVTISLPGVGKVQTPVTVTDLIYDGNIGLPLMRRFIWQLDVKNKKVRITKT